MGQLIPKHSQEIRPAMASAALNTAGTSPPTSASTFTILYFATASSFTTLSSEELPAPLPLVKLFPTLESRYPGITTKVLKSCAVTVNLEYVDIEEDLEAKLDCTSEGLLIKPGDEVGIIPPVSSG
jgi:molybdopterin synthase sulfur carrier subunit